jgi:hypothetical protein
MNKILLLISSVCVISVSNAQYAPPATQPGSTAIHRDSAVFVNWAGACSVVRGYMDISDPQSGYASAGDSSMATGKSPGAGVVSLGDGGSATCTFPYPLMNGPGYDFAVFENAFDDALFLELAFVEVSSDGINFFRFPAHSLTDTVAQTGSFGSTDVTKINNLAGKYRAGFGTPFDLEEMKNIAGLNTTAVTHIRIVDVVGSVNSLYASRDSYGNKVNDPWPTPFPSSGFDLDAIGVIHENRITGLPGNVLQPVLVYPNPARQHDVVSVSGENITMTEIYAPDGRLLRHSGIGNLQIKGMAAGIYIIRIHTMGRIETRRLVIR